jgi:predicted MFS family arabinose efflux permease
MENDNNKKPSGYYLSYGIAIGLPLGVAIGTALGNIAIGPAIGVGIGAGLGSMWEAKAKSEGRIRELTEEEKKRNSSKVVWALLAAVGVFVGVFLFYLFLK